MSANYQIEEEPAELSKNKLVSRDDAPGIFFPLTSDITTPAANGDVFFCFEVGRSNWYDGAAKIGRPRHDRRCCVQASLFLLLSELSSRCESPTFIELLVDDAFPADETNGHRAHPGSVRGYRLWWAAPMTHVMTASQVLAELLGGPDPARTKRLVDGTTKLVVPGKHEVSCRRFYNEAQYLSAVQAYNMGLYQGYRGGLSYEAVAPGADTSAGAVPAHGDDEDDTFFPTGAPSQGSVASTAPDGEFAPVLHESHALASFEAARLFDTNMTENRHRTFGLCSEQTNLASYIPIRGQLQFPKPELVVPIIWQRSSVFSSSESLKNFLLPDLFPECSEIKQAIGDAVAAQGGDIWCHLRQLDTPALLQLFQPDAQIPLMDPTVYAPIVAPTHSLQPTAALQIGFGPTAMARAFPIVERTRSNVMEVRRMARSHSEIDATKIILDRMKQLFQSEADAGIPSTYYEVNSDRAELEAILRSDEELNRRVKKARRNTKRNNQHIRRCGGPVEFASIFMFNLADMLSKLGVTQTQLVPIMLMVGSLGKLGEHSLKHLGRVVFSLEGHVALGKTFILQILASLLPKSLLVQESTRSQQGSNCNLTNKVIIRDDVSFVNSPDQNAQLKTELTLGVHSHTVNEQHPSGIGRVVRNHEWVRNCFHFWSSNCPMPIAVADRVIQVSMLDNADAGGGRTKMDLASAPTNANSQLANTIAMKLMIIDSFEFWQQEAVGGLTYDITMFHVCLNIMRSIMGRQMILSTRLIGHAKTLTIAFMALRLTTQWNTMLMPQILAHDAEADVDALRVEFYQVRSYATCNDFFHAVSALTLVADQRRYVYEVAAAIRDRIVVEPGGQEASDSEDALYYLTDLPTTVGDIAQGLVGMVKSMQGEGLLQTFVTKLMNTSKHGHPVLKVSGARRGGGGRKLLVLKRYIVSDKIVTPLETKVWKALYTYFEKSASASLDSRNAAIAFANEDEANPTIVFKKCVKDALFRPTHAVDCEPDTGLVQVDEADLARTIMFMQEKGNNGVQIRDDQKRYLNMHVANVFDCDDHALIPDGAVDVPKEGPIAKQNPGRQLKQCSKLLQEVLAVSYDTLKTRAGATSADNNVLLDKVFNAAYAVEGATQVGECVAFGALSTADAQTHHPCTSGIYGGVPEGWELKLKNPRYRGPTATSSDEDGDGDDSHHTVQSETDPSLFPDGLEYVTFNAESHISERIERRKALNETGRGPEDWLKRSAADMVYET